MDKFLAVIDLCRNDSGFRAQMRAEPAAALAGQGVNIAPGVELRVVEDRADMQHFVLPPDPNALLEDSGLDAVSGGSTVTWSSSGSYGFV